MREVARGYYLYHGSLQGALTGVDRKVAGQIKALRDSGINCELINYNPNVSVKTKVARRLPFCSDGYCWQVLDSLGDADYLYLRRPVYISKEMIYWLTRFKDAHPDTKILYEIPTYPYDEEMKSSLSQRLLLIKESSTRSSLKTCVDRIVDLSGQKKIFGISTLQIMNGTDMSEVVPKNPALLQTHTINIICVAAFCRWHGVDRALSGLKAMIESGCERKVHLHLLGDGSALSALKKMVASTGLDKCVTFYGKCDRAEMDAIYNKCSMALASLGLHRIGLSIASTLKTREYLAKGIPFVYSGEIDVFREDPVDFCFQVPADESPIDIEKLVAFHDRLYAREPEDDLIARIRSYAESHVGMNAAMKNVIDYIKENCAHEN